MLLAMKRFQPAPMRLETITKKSQKNSPQMGKISIFLQDPISVHSNTLPSLSRKARWHGSSRIDTEQVSQRITEPRQNASILIVTGSTLGIHSRWVGLLMADMRSERLVPSQTSTVAKQITISRQLKGRLHKKRKYSTILR